MLVLERLKQARYKERGILIPKILKPANTA